MNQTHSQAKNLLFTMQSTSTKFKYERLSPANSAILFVDHQTGLANGVQDQSPPDFTNNVIALAKIAKLFEVPSVITSSFPDGPNGPIMPQVLDILPDAPVIHRPGQVNAWDNEDFVKAVKNTGRKKLLIAGIATEVCVAFVALSAIEAGFEVYAVIDSSGTWSKLLQEIAVARMVQAGAVPITWFAVSCELQLDWRKPTGQAFAKLLAEHLPFYGNLIGSHNAASAAALKAHNK